MTADDQELVSRLLDGLEDRLPVPDAARSRSRATALAAFDEVVASESEPEVDGTWVEWDEGDVPPDVRRLEPRTPHRNWRPLLVAAAVAVIAGVVGASLILLDPAEDDLESVAGDDVSGDEVAGDDEVAIDGLTFRLPADLELVDSVEGRLTFASGEQPAEGRDLVTVIAVEEWGEPLRLASLPVPDAPESVRDWLADSPTDQSRLVLAVTGASGGRIEGWVVGLASSGAAAVGCERLGPCGVVAVGADGTAIPLTVERETELVMVEIPGRRPLLITTLIPEGAESNELVTAELARSIIAGNG